MKRILPLIFCLVSFANAFSQCSSCTINITGNDVADHSVSIGQVLCIQPGGMATGHLYISSGGKLCNQGTINSPDVYVSGGGEIDNYGIATMDTLYISDPSAVLNNYDTMRFNQFGAGVNVVITNNGWIHAGGYGDTAVTFINNGSFIIDSSIYIGPNSSFTNAGSCTIGRYMYTGAHNTISNSGALTIGADIYTDTLDQFNNSCTMLIKGGFYNGRGCVFATSKMVTVQGDWYNGGIIDGPTTGCGGFSIGGQSYNQGTVGDTGHIDLCDAGHPTGGIDGNSGTLTGVTFCQCTDTCAVLQPSGVKNLNGNEMAYTIYPNPASDWVQIRCSEEMEATVSIQNMLGEVIEQYIMVGKELGTNTSNLSTGLYIVVIESQGAKYSSKLEIIR